MEAYELVLLRSLISEGEVLERHKLEFLSPEQMTEILGYYSATPRPLSIIEL